MLITYCGFCWLKITSEKINRKEKKNRNDNALASVNRSVHKTSNSRI